MPSSNRRVVIVGGGAGGLELAVRLARRSEADVLLIDATDTHVWKPRLHELAAGMNRGDVDEVNYAALADHWQFGFEQGRLVDIDVDNRALTLAEIRDSDDTVRAPERSVDYDVLVLALGGVTPDLGIDGVTEHTVVLDRAEDAETLARRFSTGLLGRAASGDDQPFRVVIVGSGLTGVELAGHLATDAVSAALAPRSAAPPVEITIVEATDTFMPGMDGKVRQSVRQRLTDIGVAIHTGQQVSAVRADRVETGEAHFPADLIVWATGRVGPMVVATIDGLSYNKKRQWRVRPTLQSLDADNVFVLGDCSSIDDDPAPPSAEAASEQATHLATELPRWLAGETPRAFHFESQGTLLSLGTAGSVGRIRGLFGRDLKVHGRLSRAAYRGLERQHQFILLGTVQGTFDVVRDAAFRAGGPNLKVH